MSTVDDGDEWGSSKRSSSVEREETKRSKMMPRDIAVIVCVDAGVTEKQQAGIDQVVFRRITKAVFPRKIKFVNANAYFPESDTESNKPKFNEQVFKHLVSACAIDYDVMFMMIFDSEISRTLPDISKVLGIEVSDATIHILCSTRSLFTVFFIGSILPVRVDNGVVKPDEERLQRTIDVIRNFTPPKEFEKLVSTDSVLTRLITASLLEQSGFSDFNTKGIYDVRLYFYVKHFTGRKHKAKW